MKQASKAYKGYGRHIELGRYAALPLDEARGARVHSVRGTLWITQQGDGEDHIVRAGEDFLVNRDGTTLVAALDGPATVLVTAPAPRERGAIERWLESSSLVGGARHGASYETH